MSYIRHICLTGLISLGQFASAEISPELAEAASPLTGGVPEVAVARLQALLGRNLPPQEWRAIAEKLVEAQVAAKQSQAALELLADPRLRDSSAGPWSDGWDESTPCTDGCFA